MSASDVLLITGGAGYIGSHLARLAHDRGKRVVVIDKGNWPQLPSEVVEIAADIGRTDIVRDVILKYKPTAIVHLAAEISVTESIRHPPIYWRENFIKTIGLLDLIAGVYSLPFVLASSAAVYGNPTSAPIIEDDACVPLSPYGATKLACEQALASYAKAYDMKWAALRFFNVAGAHPDGTLAERHDPETHLVPLAIDAAMGKGPPVTIYGDGGAVRDYVHVMDIAEGCLAALFALDVGRPVGCINLGGGRSTTANAVLEAVERVLGKPVPHVHADPRPGEPRGLLASIYRASDRLGWSPQLSNLDRIIEDAARSRHALR